MAEGTLLSAKRAEEFGAKLDFVSHNLETLFRDVTTILNTTNKLRTRTLAFAEHLKAYSDGETPGLRQALSGLSDCLRIVEDHRRTMYDRLIEKVYRTLNGYADKCAEARSWRQQRTKAVSGKKPAATAQADAAEDRERQDAVFVDRMRRFEQEKIADVKGIAGHWVHAHMEFCARSMEMLSDAHQLILLVEETPELAQSLRGVADDASSGGQQTAAQPPGKPSPLRNEVPVLSTSLGGVGGLRRTLSRPSAAGGDAAAAGGGGGGFGMTTPSPSSRRQRTQSDGKAKPARRLDFDEHR